MPLQIALCWNEKSAEEMESMGFEKREVYIKKAPGVISKEAKERGDAEFFSMRHPPYQFCTTDYWGAGPE